MESAPSSSSRTTSTPASNTLTASIPTTDTTVTQILSSSMATSTSTSARTSSSAISDTTSTISTTTTSSSRSTPSSTSSTATTTSSGPASTTSSSTTTLSSSPTSTTFSTTSTSATSTTTSSSSSSTTTSISSTTTSTSSSPRTSSIPTSTSSTPVVVLPKTTISTDDPALTSTPTATAATVITTVVTSTGSNGTVVTITQVQINPTLSPNNKEDSSNSNFFSNTGAVAGTFILVGLTIASIVLWILFYVRRRRRRRQLEHESAVSATLAAAGLYRSPVDDDDPQDRTKRSPYGASPDVDMNQRPGSRAGIATMNSRPSNGRMSVLYNGPDPEGEAQNSFAEFGVTRPDGYMPARTSSPDAHYTRDRQGSTSTGGFVKGHSASHSVGSYEPLLAAYNRPPNTSPPSPTLPLAPVANQTAATAADSKPRESTNIHNPENTDGRLDPNIRQRLENGGDDASARELRDEEDYSRPVLQVRNVPDSASRES